MDLQGKAAIVTGAGTGVGRATAAKVREFDQLAGIVHLETALQDEKSEAGAASTPFCCSASASRTPQIRNALGIL